MFSWEKKSVLEDEARCIKDNKRRLLFAENEVKRNLYKAGLRDPNLPGEIREKFAYKLAKLPRNSSVTRVRNRCIYTGRARGVYAFCRMSRIVFRELAGHGMINGIKKASW